MTSEEAEGANLSTLTVGIEGKTTYNDGEEFLISIVDVNNTYNDKSVPTTYKATYVADTNKTIGYSETNYFTEREDKDANIYLLNATGQVKEDKQILVGYIKSDNTGIKGTLTISAYIDKERIAISDTYDGTGTGANGTTSEWVKGRTVFTTTEWNAFQNSNNQISFKIKAESNEGIWVEEGEPDNVLPGSCFAKTISKTYILNTNMTQVELHDCVTYIESLNYTFDNNETAENYCLGLATRYGQTFQETIDSSGNSLIENHYFLESHNIIIPEIGLDLYDYDASCGSDIIIPDKINYTRMMQNNMPSNKINICVDYFTNNLGFEVDVDNGETMEDFCAGTGTMWGYTFQEYLDEFNGGFSPEILEYFESENIVIQENVDFPVTTIARYYSLAQLQDITSIKFNKSLKYIGTIAFYEPYSFPKDITIPVGVRYIAYSAFIFKDDSTIGITIPNSIFTILGNPYVDAIALPAFETIRYGGTCQELIKGTDAVIQSKGYTYGESFNVITTDTNSCEVFNGFYD